MKHKHMTIVIVFIVGVAVGYYFGFDHGFERAAGGEIPRDGGGVACTMEAKECPDGTFVGRVPPTCEFAPCPGK